MARDGPRSTSHSAPPRSARGTPSSTRLTSPFDHPDSLHPKSSMSSLESNFSNMTLTGPLGPSRSRLRELQYNSVDDTPSETSASEDEETQVVIDEGLRRWASRTKGKGKAVGRGDEAEGLAGNLPPEVLVQILRLLDHPRDLYSALRVSRSWCLAGFSLLWSKPHLTSATQLAKLTRVLQSPNPSLPYASQVRRLHLSGLSSVLSEHLIDGLERCTRVDRLTMPKAGDVSSAALRKLVSGMKEATAIDLAETAGVNDWVVLDIAEHCEKIQGLNLGGCKDVGDEGLKAIAEKRRGFRRVKIRQCHRVTDASIVRLSQNCPLIIDYDLSFVPQITNASLYSIFLHSSHLRELHLVGNGNINDEGIPNLRELVDDASRSSTPEDPERIPWYATLDSVRIAPRAKTFEFLRVVDFSSCAVMNDLGVANLVANAPKIRHLTLAKCPLLTDAALEAIAKLGKHLHHLHLGHDIEITDAGVAKLVRSCTRIRYLDLACCAKLTDISVIEIVEHLPKLRRIGLVKVVNITDEAVYALVDRHTTLERIHLSYCDNLTVRAVTFMLNRLLRLTHLSLTAVSAFKVPELQQFCRATPSEFSTAQRESFCVYSGHGITALRKYLNAQAAAATSTGVTSDEGSRRGSGSSQSSLTLPGQPTPPHHAPDSAVPMNPLQAVYATQQWMQTSQPLGWNGEMPRGSFATSSAGVRRADQSHLSANSSATTSAGGSPVGLGRRRPDHEPRGAEEVEAGAREHIPAPVFRYAGRQTTARSEDTDTTLPGLPRSVLASTTPNFLVPPEQHPALVPPSERSARERPRTGVRSRASGRTPEGGEGAEQGEGSGSRERPRGPRERDEGGTDGPSGRAIERPRSAETQKEQSSLSGSSWMSRWRLGR